MQAGQKQEVQMTATIQKRLKAIFDYLSNKCTVRSTLEDHSMIQNR